MSAIRIRSKFTSSCKTCGGKVYVNQEVFWTPGSKGVSHTICPDPSKDTNAIIIKDTVPIAPARARKDFPQLFSHQQEIVNTVEKNKKSSLYLALDAGLGKAQPLSSKVLTPNGYVRMGDIKVGTIVSTPDGGSAPVTGVFPQGKEQVFKVTLNDGSSTLASGNHLWTVIRSGNFSKKPDGRARYSSRTETISTEELMSRKLAGSDGRLRYRIPDVVTSFPESSHIIDPYFLGALLGDGGFSAKAVTFTSADEEIHAAVSTLLPEGVLAIDCNDPITKRLSTGHVGGRNPLIAELRRLGLMGHTSHHKFIPEEYKIDSRENRIALVQGMMDTDGYISKASTMEFVSVSETLAKDFLDVVRSLGSYAKISKKNTSWTHLGTKKYGVAWRVQFNVPKSNPFNPFRLSRKADLWRNAAQRQRRILSIEPAGVEETQCIMVEHPDHLYITDDYIVTHNTYSSLASASVADAFPLIIICPSVVKINWQRETKMWLDKDAQILKGRTPYEITSDVIIVNYEILEYWVDDLVALSPRGFIADESHKLKNKTAKRTRAALKLAENTDGMKLLLSGTPTPNSVYDLVAPLKIMGVLDKFGGERAFVNRYCPPIQTRYGVSHARSTNKPELHKNLMNVGFIRRRREDCLDLPEKIRVDLTFETDVETNMKFYRPFIEKMKSGTMKEAKRVISEGDQDAIYEEFLREREAVGVAKIPYIVDVVEGLNEPTVIMVHHKKVVAELMKKFKRRNPVRLVGGMSEKDRQESIDKFQGGSTDLMIASITAAGVGVNLQRGTQMVIGELPYTYADVEQAESRCHRAGAKNDLTVTKLIIINSSDELLQKIIDRKEADSASVEDGENIQTFNHENAVAKKLLWLYNNA